MGDETDGERTEVGTRGDTVSIEKLGSDLRAGMEAPSDHAIEQESARQLDRQAEWAGLRDRHGRSFDAALHITDGDGTPKTTPTGKLRVKKGAGITRITKSSTPGEPGLMTPGEQYQAKQGGKAAAHILVTSCVTLFGDEWTPIVDEGTGIHEMQNLENCFGDYFVAKEIRDLSPGWALAIGLAGYALPRFTQPKTRSRFQQFKGWVKTKYQKIQKRRTGENGAQSDTRNDDQRENDSSQETKPGLSGARDKDAGSG